MQKRNTNRPIHLCLTLSQDSYAAHHFLELFNNYKYPSNQTMLINNTKKTEDVSLETPL